MVGFTEVQADWVPRTVGWLDYLWDSYASDELKAQVPLLPSEYWHRQCFVGAAVPSIEETEMRRDIGIESFMYGTDFPHSISPWGVSDEYLQATMGRLHVPEDEARAMLGENAARVFGLDVAKLAPIVERVGPRPEDVLTVPAGTDVTEKMSPYLKGWMTHATTM
jgi:hypothetical protein